jgi:aminopeptidase
MQLSSLDALATRFIGHALNTTRGERVLIEYNGPEAAVLAQTCATKTAALGAHAYLVDTGSAFLNALENVSGDQLRGIVRGQIKDAQPVHHRLHISDPHDLAKLRLSAPVYDLYLKATHEIFTPLIQESNWLLVAAPTDSFARQCGMNAAAFENFYLKPCLMDYLPLYHASERLRELMAPLTQVRVRTPSLDTDLRLQFDNVEAVACRGHYNLPDGECYTAPVLDSLNGRITFGPTTYEGQSFQFIKACFKNGIMLHVEAENRERTGALNAILNTDPGARSAGEFGKGFNPYIRELTGNFIFDEKITSTIHIGMGGSLPGASNGNASRIYWDWVHDMRQGGELWFDDVLIQKDGLFVHPDLLDLNPATLLRRLEPG